MPLSQALSHLVPVVAQIPRRLLSYSQAERVRPWGGSLSLECRTPSPTPASRFPPALELESVLQRPGCWACGRSASAFMHLPSVQKVTPTSSSAIRSLARTSLFLRKAVSSVLPISNHHGYCSTTSRQRAGPRPSLARDCHT